MMTLQYIMKLQCFQEQHILYFANSNMYYEITKALSFYVFCI